MDNLNKRGKPDRDRINLNEPWEVRAWCEHFGCTSEELREAVYEVGDRANNVAVAIERIKRRRVR